MAQFAHILGVPFNPNAHSGLKMHVHGQAYDKKRLAPIYSQNGVVGQTTNIKLIYSILLPMFRHTLTPKAGNKDKMRGAEINLMAHAHSVYTHGPDHPGGAIDVMDFIYQDMYKFITDKKCPLVAPYVMKLIVAQAPATPLLYTDLVPHLPTKLQRKGAPTSKAPRGYPSAQDIFEDDEMDADASDSADGSEEVPEAVACGPRMKHASNAFRFDTSKEEVRKKVKKASWWKKLLLCQNIDIHHGQYCAYKANRNVMKELKRINQPMDVDPP